MSRFWDAHARTIDPERFRAHDQYLSQRDIPYEELARFIGGMTLDRLGGEDGAFGCETAMVDGRMVSRDLLDSALEIDFASPILQPETNVVDIGAGYGRLAHRWTLARREDTYLCTDPVGVSRNVCRRYLQHRHISFAMVTSPEDSEPWLPGIQLAINVHSWSECTPDEVAWWMERLARARVQRLFVVPHHQDFRCFDAGTAGVDNRGGGHPGEFRSVIERHGYTLEYAREAWPSFYPKYYYMFRRNDR